ncbi:MAG: sialate O-acetylesterase [Bacteroidia bacterium]
MLHNSRNKVIGKFPFLNLFLLFFLQTEAQINFERIPKDFAIVPRNAASNIGTFRISGIVTDPSYSFIEIRSYLKGNLKGKSIMNLYFKGSSAYFDLQLNQIAGLLNYDFQIYLNSTLVKEVKSVAFGDIILITGQSNAVANTYNGLANTKYRDSFIRSFGTATAAASAVAADTNWYVANGDGYYGQGTVGQWGLILARQIMDSIKIPIGIINNAVGGTPITYHKKNNSNPLDLNTSYGRHLYRATKAEVSKKARFMYYYQGESDGAAVKLHDSLFKIMHRDWRSDFPGLEKVYVVQVRGGCGSPSLPLREAQRQFEFTLPITRTLTMNGFNGHDGCHFALKNGYESLGFEAANCLMADFYTKKNKSDVYPLNPVYAYFSKSDYTQITLELNQNIQNLKADANFYQLFQLEGNPGVTISGGSIINNKIVLTLSGKVCKIEGLSYDGKAAIQPWVTNRNGVGLLTFYKLPIFATKRVGGTVHLCNGEKFTPKIDTIAGYTYLWKGKSSKISSTKAWPAIKPTQSEIFELIIQDKLKICKADTQLYYLNLDSVKNPNLDPYIHLCPGDSFKTVLNYPSHSFVWKRYNSFISKTDYIIIKKDGIYTVDIVSQSGCQASDTITVGQSLPSNILDSNYRTCPETFVTLKTKRLFSRYQWNNDSTLNTDSLVVKNGLVRITAIDSASCLYRDSAKVENYITEKFNLETQPQFCDYAFHRYFKPIHCMTWYLNEKEISNSFHFFTKYDSGYYRFVDSNKCIQSLKITPKIFSKPYQHSDSFIICNGKPTTVQLNQKYNYQWYDGIVGANKTVNKPGIYKFIALNNSCEYQDSILVWLPIKPVWNIPADTIICEGSRIHYDLPKTLYDVKVNGITFKDSVEIKGEGLYEISGFDSLNCSYNWNLKVTEKICINNVKKASNTCFNLYPNPITDHLFLISAYPTKDCLFTLFDYTGKELPFNFKSICSNKINLDLTLFPSGVYFLKIRSSGNLFYYKIVKK